LDVQLGVIDDARTTWCRPKWTRIEAVENSVTANDLTKEMSLYRAEWIKGFI